MRKSSNLLLFLNNGFEIIRKNDAEIINLVRMILIYHFARIIILIRMISELTFLQEQYQNYRSQKNDVETIILTRMMPKLSF